MAGLERTLKFQPQWVGSNAKGYSSRGKIWEHRGTEKIAE